VSLKLELLLFGFKQCYAFPTVGALLDVKEHDTT